MPPPPQPDSIEAVFAPVRSQTAFEETLERLGTAIRLGLLAPGTRLPAERDLCRKLGISRSTLRQALVALAQSGHLHAVRGRSGGTFVMERLPADNPPTPSQLAGWRDACDRRLAVELGVVALAVARADGEELAPLDELITQMAGCMEDFDAYRTADVRFHMGLAQATGSRQLVASATEAQGAMTHLISFIPHPPEVLEHSNAQHASLLAAIRRRDEAEALRITSEHLRGTEHVLAGLLPTA